MPAPSSRLLALDSRLLALDIGGANLKAADGQGFAFSRPFPLWQRPHELPQALAEMIAAAPPCERVVATMTGELADCYETKAAGVRSIVDAVVAAAGTRDVAIYLVTGRLADPAVASAQPLLAAASNWHALAAFCGRYAPTGNSLLIDIGSTTTDLIPLHDGRPVPLGLTDPERLLAGELVYTGVERSPICALVRTLPWRGQSCAVAQELFATAWDAWLLLARLPEEPSARHTADGRPATRAAAHDRMSRMICADRTLFDFDDALRAAAEVATAQRRLIGEALARVLARMAAGPSTAVISGRGSFLAREILASAGIERTIVDLDHELGPAVSGCAPAHALAVLAREAEARHD